MMKTDETLQKNVVDELAFDPAVKASDIGVTVHSGVVTLRGTVTSFAEKFSAEHAAKRVSGVRTYTDELTVEVPLLHRRDDRDIAKAVLDVLTWDVTVPGDTVKAKIDNGFVLLEGEVDWQFEIDNAKRAVQYLTGVRGITNRMTLKPRTTARDIIAKLEQTFKRSAEIDADKIQIEIHDGSVTLRGSVHSWYEFDDATRAAFSLPGVKHVENLTHVA